LEERDTGIDEHTSGATTAVATDDIVFSSTSWVVRRGNRSSNIVTMHRGDVGDTLSWLGP